MDERWAAFREIDVPAQWDAIVRLADDGPRRSEDEPRRRRAPLITAAVVVVLVAGATAFAIHRSGGPVPVQSGSATTATTAITGLAPECRSLAAVRGGRVGTEAIVRSGPGPIAFADSGVSVPGTVWADAEIGRTADGTLAVQVVPPSAHCVVHATITQVDPNDLADIVRHDIYLDDGLGRPVAIGNGPIWPWPGTGGYAIPAGDSLLDPSDTALGFAREVLGWPDARVAIFDPVSGDDSGAGYVTVTAVDTGGVVRIATTRVLGGRWYGVTGVLTGPSGDPALSVQIRAASAMVATDAAPAGAVRAALRVTHGSSTAHAFTDTLPPTFVSVPLEYTAAPGSVLILFFDRAGVVVGAVGTTIPARDFAAG